MSCLVGNSDCSKQSSILTLEKSQKLCLALGEGAGKGCAGPWALGRAMLGGSPAAQQEQTADPALTNSPCTAERPFAPVPAGFISSYP